MSYNVFPKLEITDYFCDENCSMLDAMRTIEDGGLKIAVINNIEGKFIGILTDSDIRRAILKGCDVNNSISEITNRTPIIIYEEELSDKEITKKINELMRKEADPKIIPVLKQNKEVVNLLILSNNQYKLLEEGLDKEDLVKCILVIGGAGYLGSVLCRKLLDNGYKVKAMDICLFGEGPIRNLKKNKNFKLIKEDIRDITNITRALSKVDAVILLAAIVGDPACNARAIDTIETNYLATKVIAEACKYHQINRFIFASTCSVYGVGNKILDEKSKLNPVSLYARSKVRTEEAILELVDYNFSPTILRMGTLYGVSPRMRFDLVVNSFVLKALTERKISIFGGDQWRPLLNVEDAADAYIKCLEAPLSKVSGEIFNVGSEEQNYQISTLGAMIKELFPTVVVEYSDKEIIDGKLDLRNYKVAFEKIQNTITFKPNKSIKESMMEIRDMLTNEQIKDPSNPQYYNLNSVAASVAVNKDG